MTDAMKITLSTQPADARWGEKATYSINNDGITPVSYTHLVFSITVL